MRTSLVLVVACLASAAYAQYNYGEALSKSILFYEAQRSGRLPADNRIPYRADSAMDDRGNSGEDLTGGWYDAGDHVKFGFPFAQSMTTLAWGILEFESAYRAAGEYNNALSQIRWGYDYFIKAHTGTNVFYGQVGNGDLDHSWWGRPEDMTMSRPAYTITQSAPGSDLAGEVAAAFAAGYMVFRSTDATYANTLLTKARQLYDFAYNYRGVYSNSISDANNYYASSGYTDELAYGAAWLYRATGEAIYLTRALEFANTGDTAWAFDWDEKTVGYQLLLASTGGQSQFTAGVQRFITAYRPGGSVQYTPKGLAWRSQWGALRYSANAAFIALVAAKYNIMATDARNFASSQINYMLGDAGRSFVVGFGTNPPAQPHHKAASCPNRPAGCSWTDFSSPNPNPQILYGALVGGPDAQDNYADVRSDYVMNEVSCDYNAGFQGAVAGLLALQVEKYLG